MLVAGLLDFVVEVVGAFVETYDACDFDVGAFEVLDGLWDEVGADADGLCMIGLVSFYCILMQHCFCFTKRARPS